MLAAVLFLSALPMDSSPPRRIVILGDSISAAGMYAADLEAELLTQDPATRWELINLGLPSETISGLSEPSHPWPRPNVHERLRRALDLKPDLLIACYGMNDGIYHPFSDDRFAKFQKGVDDLISAAQTAKIPLILVTPPPFDPRPIAQITRPAGADSYGWQTPYALYQEEVLARYAEWESGLKREGVTVVDIQAPLARFLDAQRRKPGGADYRFADDGVHMNSDGHWLMARAIAPALRIPKPDAATLDARSLQALGGDVADLRRESGGLAFRWKTRLPVPLDPTCSETLRKEDDPSTSAPPHRLTITGLDDGRYRLFEGNTSLGTFATRDGELVIDLRKLPQASSNRQADELGDLVRRRERVMSPAWRDHVGHTRPDTEKGLPLKEARAQVQEVSERIERLRKPVTLNLRLVRQ